MFERGARAKKKHNFFLFKLFQKQTKIGVYAYYYKSLPAALN